MSTYILLAYDDNMTFTSSDVVKGVYDDLQSACDNALDIKDSDDELYNEYDIIQITDDNKHIPVMKGRRAYYVDVESVYIKWTPARDIQSVLTFSREEVIMLLRFINTHRVVDVNSDLDVLLLRVVDHLYSLVSDKDH